MSRTPSRLHRALAQALLVGSPLPLGCAVSSCPDDGIDPPVAITRGVDPSFADGGPLDAEQCRTLCDEQRHGLLTCVRGSPNSVLCLTLPMPCEGRRPAALLGVSRREPGEFERHLADAAHLESASVEAFRVLRRELREHGAPRALLRAASRARRDERRHWRASRALARSFGLAVSPAHVERRATRPLVEVATENAVEGCVRETWGALVALHQAEHATERAIRATMLRIARDECRHAELAWAVDAWVARRLPPTARARIRRAKSEAVELLFRELASSPAGATGLRLGLPHPARARAMLVALDQSLWRAYPRASRVRS